MACGILVHSAWPVEAEFPNQGLNPHLLPWKHRVASPGTPESMFHYLLNMGDYWFACCLSFLELQEQVTTKWAGGLKGGLKQQKHVLSQFWRLEIQTQGASETCGDGSFLASPSFSRFTGRPWPVGASLQALLVVTWHLPFCLCPHVALSSSNEDTSHVETGSI